MIRALQSLLTHAHPYPITNTFLSTRLLKSLLPCLTRFLSQEPTAPSADAQEDARSTKAKKKAKMYEGDEVFRTTRDVLVRSAPEGDEILATLHRMFNFPKLNSGVFHILTLGPLQQSFRCSYPPLTRILQQPP